MTSARWAVIALNAVLLTAAWSSGVAEAAGDPVAGHQKAYTCFGCHGIPGYNNAYPEYHVPKLGGQNADYLSAALHEYQAGDRSHPTMRTQAGALTEQDIADIAAYLSTAPAKE